LQFIRPKIGLKIVVCEDNPRRCEEQFHQGTTERTTISDLNLFKKALAGLNLCNHFNEMSFKSKVHTGKVNNKVHTGKVNKVNKIHPI